jgi:hypothetical protein
MSSDLVRLLNECTRSLSSVSASHGADVISEQLASILRLLEQTACWDFSDRRLCSSLSNFLSLLARCYSSFATPGREQLHWLFCACDSSPPVYGAMLPLGALCECLVSWPAGAGSAACAATLAADLASSPSFQTVLASLAPRVGAIEGVTLLQWHSTVHNLVCLPDLVANALRARSELPACFQPSTYFAQVAAQVVKLSDSKVVLHDELLLPAMSKLVSRAKAACLASAWVAHRLALQHAAGVSPLLNPDVFLGATAPEWRITFFRHVLKIALFDAALPPTEHVNRVVAVCGIRPSLAVHGSLSSLLQLGALPEHCVRACTSYLIHQFHARVDLTSRQDASACPHFLAVVPFDVILSVWSSRSFVDDTEAAKQASVSCFLELCIAAAPLPLLQPEVFASTIVYRILEGVQASVCGFSMCSVCVII